MQTIPEMVHSLSTFGYSSWIAEKSGNDERTYTLKFGEFRPMFESCNLYRRSGYILCGGNKKLCNNNN